MMDGEDLWIWAKDYPYIYAKLQMIADFHASVDPRMTREWFRYTGPPSHLKPGEPYAPRLYCRAE